MISTIEKFNQLTSNLSADVLTQKKREEYLKLIEANNNDVIDIINNFDSSKDPGYLINAIYDQVAYQEWEEMLRDNDIAEDILSNNEYNSYNKTEQKPTTDSYTEQLINKIRAAGIEVITDKKQFDEILESEDILQKMSNDEIIKNMAKQRDDAIEEKNRINAKKLEDFKAEVKSYAPLIKELIKAGNTLLENGFDLEGWKGHTGHYSDGSFYADGWTHKFGFKYSNGKIVAVGRSLGDDGEKYFIYSDGENIDIGPYTFRYDHNYDWEPKGWLDGIQKFKTTLAEKFNLNFDNIKRNEKERTELELSNRIELETKIVNISNEEKQLLSEALKETAEEFVSVVYSWENYRRIFDINIIESPLETINLGPNQFVKLSPGNRNNFMYAIRQTLENPSIILGKETWDNNSETFKPVHLYGKSFINELNSEKLVESLIIFKEGNNIAVSLHPNGIDKFVEQIKTTNDIIYLDDEVSRVIGELSMTKGDNVVKENENFLSRIRQVSYSSLGQESYPLVNINYNKDNVLSTNEFIASHNIETGKLEINKDNFDRYFNILNQHKDFKDNRNKIASELFNYHVSSENKEAMKQWLSEQGYEIKEQEATQYMTNNNGLTYGFVHNGKIYLNPDLMNSNAAVHEYTHLWDAYTKKTNPKLWNKGFEIFRDTKYWNEVISDPNYQDIKDDENLVLSEIHSRICGDMAEKVLNRIAELDGEQVKLEAIDWNKETASYVLDLIKEINPHNDFIQNMKKEDISQNVLEFFSTPMNDLIQGKDISIADNLSKEQEIISSYIVKNSELKKSIVSEPSVSYMPRKDPDVTREVINNAKAGRASYCNSILQGERKGLWKSFNEFKRHGVFDIQGQTVITDDKGHLTDTGFKQLAAAMDIYRDKRFESARYVFIDKDGIIKDQMALSTFMPNHSISKLDETFKQVLTHAQKTDTRIAFVHNHPSGNIEASYDDIAFTEELENYLNENEQDRFLGHVILDHNTFNCYSPEKSWNNMIFENAGKDRYEKDNIPEFAKSKIDGAEKLREIAKSINSTNEYNKDWIPVIFARENATISGVEYFDKDFFLMNNSKMIQTEFEKIGFLCGADRAIPVVPNGMSYEAALHAEMIQKFREGCFYDMALGNRTTSDLNLTKYSSELFNYTQKEMEEKTKIETTFEPIKVSKKEIGISSKVAENKTYYKRENIQPVNVSKLIENHPQIPIFDHDYFVKQRFLPPFKIVDNNNVYVRCTAKDLSINSQLKINPEKRVDLILSKKQFAKIIADEKLKEKVNRVRDFEENNKAITPIEVQPDTMTALQQDLIFQQNNHLNYSERRNVFSSMYKEIMDNVKEIEKNNIITNKKALSTVNQELKAYQTKNNIMADEKYLHQENDTGFDFDM